MLQKTKKRRIRTLGVFCRPAEYFLSVSVNRRNSHSSAGGLSSFLLFWRFKNKNTHTHALVRSFGVRRRVLRKEEEARFKPTFAKFQNLSPIPLKIPLLSLSASEDSKTKNNKIRKFSSLSLSFSLVLFCLYPRCVV